MVVGLSDQMGNVWEKHPHLKLLTDPAHIPGSSPHLQTAPAVSALLNLVMTWGRTLLCLHRASFSLIIYTTQESREGSHTFHLLESALVHATEDPPINSYE